MARGPVVAVERYDTTQSGTWPCSACGAAFPVGDSWRITREQTHRQIVCPACAREAVDALAGRLRRVERDGRAVHP
jgi:ribosomal protein L37AE/L43A